MMWRAEECNIEKEQLAAQGAGTLNKKSIIKNKVMEAIDEWVTVILTLVCEVCLAGLKKVCRSRNRFWIN